MSGRSGRRRVLGALGGALVLGGASGEREAHAQSPVSAEENLRELELRRAESLLLHRKVDLSGLRPVVNGRLGSAPPPVARLLLVHIWAVECRPCVEELPILRRITDSLRDMPQVTPVLVCETLELLRLQQFLSEHRADLPRVELYQSTDEKLRRSLQNRAQPTTLLLDALYVVRQAFLGSLKQRRSEFADAIMRLARSV
jgi:hypothetical protein